MYEIKDSKIIWKKGKGYKNTVPISAWEVNTYFKACIKAGRIIGKGYAAVIYQNGKEIQAVWENPANGELYEAENILSLVKLLNDKKEGF